MLFIYALLVFLTVVMAAPTSTISGTPSAAAPPSSTSTACDAKTFDLAWELNDITIYQPSASGENGAISFQFRDNNDGLQMVTDCSGTVVNNSCEGEDGGYVICANEIVAFKLAPELIMVERYYEDDCLGSPPYNSGFAFGQNNTQTTNQVTADGTLASQELMLVEISEMA